MAQENKTPLLANATEYIVPTIVSLAIISSLILVYYIMANPDGTTNATTTPTPTVAGATTNTDTFEMTTLKEGTGEGAKAGQSVSVNYVGTLKDGTKFDSSYDRKQTFTFVLGAGNVIKGWDQGVVGMKVGEKRKLVIPPSLGYGSAGAGGVIPPNATLIFEVEMVSFK